jgi:hypothetical protein
MFVEEEILTQFMEAVKQEVIAAQKASGHVATGKSISSYETEVKRVGPMYSGILYGVGYSKYAVGGRGPGKFPPIDDIQIWAEAKGIIEASMKDYKKRSIAFAIAKKISERGTSNRGVSEVELLNEITERRIKALINSLFATTEKEITKQVRVTFGV